MRMSDRDAITKYEGAPLAQAGPYYTAPMPGVEYVSFHLMRDVIRRRWRLMLGTLLSVLILGTAYTLTRKPVYESNAMLLLAAPRMISSSSDEMGVLTDLAALTQARSVQSQMEILTSPRVMMETAHNMGEEELIKGFGRPEPGQLPIPEWALSLDTKKDSDVITITADAYDPQVAADLANGMAQTYMEIDRDFASQAARQGRVYVSSELESVKKQLDEAQKELSGYKRKTKLIVADSQLQAIVDNSLSLQMEQDKAKVELAATKHQEEALQRQLAAQGDEVQESQTIQLNPEYQAALATLGDLNAKRASLIQEYTPTSKEVRKIDGAIAETQQRMKKIADSIVATKVQARNPVLSQYLVPW